MTKVASGSKKVLALADHLKIIKCCIIVTTLDDNSSWQLQAIRLECT